MKNPKSARSRRLRSLPTPRDRLVLEAVRTHGRLTRTQISRLFFRLPHGGLASVQAANTRLKKLTSLGLLEPVVVNAGRGAGPFAYGLGPRSRDLLARLARGSRLRAPGPVWHLLEIADFRVRLQEELELKHGELIEWLGETGLRSLLLGQRGWPVADALVHWRLPDREGTFLLEWDRGTESLAVLAAKLTRYLNYWRGRGHRELLPGLGLRPRLAIVVASGERRDRLIRWLSTRAVLRVGPTVLVGLADAVNTEPLAPVWWRSDSQRRGRLTD